MQKKFSLKDRYPRLHVEHMLFLCTIFAEIAENPSETTQLLFELKHLFNIVEEELEKGEDENVI